MSKRRARITDKERLTVLLIAMRRENCCLSIRRRKDIDATIYAERRGK